MKPVADHPAQKSGPANIPPVKAAPPFDALRLRKDFPILQTLMHGKPLVYLDNAATTQKPQSVLNTLQHYYETQNANIHRGIYTLSQEATAAHEQARKKVQHFLNARHPHEIIFTRGTTESINLVAQCYGRPRFKPGDEIIISAMEHHSNIVPWQMLCEQTGAILKIVPISDQGEFLFDAYLKLLSPRTKFVAVVHTSNSLGSNNPIAEIITSAHKQNTPVLVDGAQWTAHHSTDVQQLDADFYAFSGHKIFGPTGIGVLYGKEALLDSMPPYQGGGDMIASVTFEKTTYASLPNKFEAGTPHIAGAIGLGAAIDYVTSVGLENIAAHEATLLAHATRRLAEVPGLRIIGTAPNKAAVLSFILENPRMSSLDIGMKLDILGIAVRTGHHCCQPVMDRFHIPSTARASFAFYNTLEEADQLADALKKNVLQTTPTSPSRSPSTSTTSADQVAYPPASAPTPQAAAKELAEEFTFLDARDAKNEYLLDLGKNLPALFDTLKQVTPRVEGCMSEVYLVGHASPQNPAVMEFVADANADIVRGLIAVLQRLYSGQKAADVLQFDIENFFHQIDLDQFITSQRRNGLQGMVKKIQKLATTIAQGAA